MSNKVRGEVVYDVETQPQPLIKKAVNKIIKKDNPIAKTEDNEMNGHKAMEVLSQIFQNSEKNGMSEDDIKDIENIKLIIFAILNDDLLESLTNLEPDELDDINDAMYINEFADNPRLDSYVLHRLKLSRSKVVGDKFSNLLEIFSDISGKGLKTLSQFD